MLIGETIGSYRVHRLIGKGGFGVVYAAEHQLLGRPAAIKVLRPAYSEDEAIVRRFFNEARAITQIKHPGIVEVYDFGFHDGQAFLAMELLDGESLAARLARERRLPPTLAVSIAREVARILAAAHKNGIIHRDLKPENVFLVPDVEAQFGLGVKLLDFGVAKLANPSVSSTESGHVLGTPLYMSPEQCRSAGRVDTRSDLYSLGCILYETLCGRPPFIAHGVGELLLAHMQEPPPPPRSLTRGVPPELEAMVLRLLAKSPADRPQSAEALVAELDDVVAPATERGVSNATTRPRVGAPRARGRLLGALAAALLVGGGATAWLVARGRAAPAAAPAPQRASFVVETPRLVRLAIDSRPSGATVLREDGSTAGRTPLLLVEPESQAARTFTVRLADHGDTRVSLPGDRDGQAVAELTPLATPPAAPAEPERRPAERPRRPARAPATPDDDGTVDPFKSR